MTEQWKELKETIIEMRDNDGTGTQQEVCKFLANYMDVLEKQIDNSGNPNKWIPVSERLPKIGSTVLIQFVDSSSGISMDDYGSCELSWLRVGDLWITNSGSFKESEILAWMPLQEYQPKEGE